MSEHDKYYNHQDYEREQGVYESGQCIAQDQYPPGYIDSGHQAGLADYSTEGGGCTSCKELPGHYAHQQIYGEVLLTAEEVSENNVEDQRLEKRAEQRPEEAESGILIAPFQVNYGQVPD